MQHHNFSGYWLDFMLSCQVSHPVNQSCLSHHLETLSYCEGHLVLCITKCHKMSVLANVSGNY